MRRFVFALLAFNLPIPLAAQDGDTTAIEPPILAQGVELPDAHVSLAPDGDDLRITITLATPAERLQFTRADVVRDDTMQIETRGLTLADDVISGDKPFSSISFRLIEDLTERDAKYPPFYRVDEGRLLYAPTIIPDPAQWDVTLELADMPDGWVRWPDLPLPQGYLFIGPQEMVVEEGGARFVFDGNRDAAFEAEIREMIVQSLSFLEEAFRSPPASEPFIATSVIASERSFSTGDVTANAMIGLRFMGAAPDPTAAGSLASTRSIILHEGVHFWNGGVARFARSTPMWLHEGGAEYIATISSYRLGWSDREHLQNTFGSWLDRCSTSLGWSNEVALNELDFVPSSLRYSCGPLLQLLAELYLGEDGGGPDITETWRETVGIAAQTDTREYTLADWLAASGDEGLLESPALAAILATSGAKRWNTVYYELDRLGVTIGQSTNPPLRARTALMFLIRSQCTGLGPGEGYGFYSGQQSYRLDTPEGCGLVTGNPVVETLAGFPINTLSAEDYAHMQSICAAGGTIVFGLVGGDAVDVPCPGPLAEADTTPSITALPDIPAFAR